MDRFIDSVMIGSNRIDERARLLTRLCDTVAPLVGDLGPSTPDLIRTALLGTVRVGHRRPLDVVADVLGRLCEAVGADVAWQHPDLTTGEALALGMCDGRGLSDYALGAAIGIDRDEIAAARDDARLAIGLPPAPPACTRRHPDATDREACATCMLVRADAVTARARAADQGVLPCGTVIDAVVRHATAWQADMLRPRLRPEGSGPSPWTAVAGLAV